MGAKRAHSAPAPLPVGETGGSKRQGDPSGGGSPARKGPLEERVCTGAWGPFEKEDLSKARKTGETARGGAGDSPALHPGKREGQRPLGLKHRNIEQVSAGENKDRGEKIKRGTRRRVSIAPTRYAAGPGTECSRETG